MTHTGIKESLAEFRQRVGRKQAKKRDTKRRFEKKKEKARTITKPSRRTTRSARDLVLEKARTPFTEQELASQRAEAERASVKFGGGSFTGGAGGGFDPTTGEIAKEQALAAAEAASFFVPIAAPIKGLKALKVLGKTKIAKEFFKPIQEFGLKALKGNKVDLNFMLRLGDYSQVGKFAVVTTGVATNTKSISIMANKIKKHLSKNAIKYLGGWVIATSFSLWGKAEAPEPFGFNSKYIMQDALQTGNWTIYDEAQAAELEVMNYTWWQEALSWTPVGGFVTFPKKLKGIIDSSKARMAAQDSIRVQSETNESDDEMFARIREEQAEQAKLEVDYFNEQKLETQRESIRLNTAAAAAKSERERKALLENIRLWDEYAVRSAEREEEARIASAKFWSDYYLEVARIREDTRPSSLNFGLLG